MVLFGIVLAASAGVCSVLDVGGIPRIAVDGRPIPGVAAMPSPRERPQASTGVLRTFSAAGVRLFSDVWTMRPPHPVRQWWLGEGKYDFELFDNLMKGLLDASPDALVFPRIKLEPPDSWIAAHPEEMLFWKDPATGRLADWNVRPESKSWRELYHRMLKDMVAHVEASDYADRVIGYHLGAFHCGEWHVYPSPDVKVPMPEQDPGDPLPPWNVIAERRRFFEDWTTAIAEDLVDSASFVKELTGGRKLVGAFFGYWGMTHQKLRLVLDSGKVDFFAAPPEYQSYRDSGHPGMPQAFCPASFRLHGAVFYEETDFRTGLSDWGEGTRTFGNRTVAEADGLLRRTIGRCLANGWENWWFLLGGNRTFSDPRLMASIARGAELSKTMLSTPWKPAEVAVFTALDEYATSNMSLTFDDFGRYCKNELHLEELPRCGVPYDSYELGDIADPRLPDYRVYVFPNAFTLPEELRKVIAARVGKAGVTAVWVKAPGYYREGRGSDANAAELMATASRGVCFPQPPKAAELREAFRAAGVHVWLDTPDTIAAGRGLVMVHAAASGLKRMRLPSAMDVEEVFGADSPRRNVKEFEEKLELGETRVYRLKPAEEVVIRADAVEVVRDWRACSTVRFAADEMTNFLARVLGKTVPLVYEPTGGGRTSVIVGTNRWSAAAGVRPEALARDGYVVKAERDRVYVAGCDDPSVDMQTLLAAKKHWAFFTGERATVFAVYDFLDRFAGVRFYFPGELGTIVPRKDEIRVPGGTLTREPDSVVREFNQDVQPLSYLRLGGQSKYTPCAHGLVGLNLQERFGRTHPEWFALMRDLDGVNRRMTQFRTPWFEKWMSPCYCLSNDGLWNQIHDDAVAYFSGVSAKDHGIPNYWADNRGWSWGHGCWYGEFVDVMPEDGMRPCLCPNCQAAYQKDGKGSLVNDYATELVWRRTAELGRRLQREGVKGFITQMAYSPYRELPTCELPTNVLVMVAVNGPWTEGDPERRDLEDGIVRSWTEKAPGRVWLWTYPAKFAFLNWPGVPQMTPRAFGAYLKRRLPQLRGMKFEAHTDKPIYNYLNDYVASKLLWDNRADVNAILSEHFELMFGGAAEEMRGFYDLLERKWIGEVASRAGGNGTGKLKREPVSVAELWTGVYMSAVLEECRGHFERGARLVRAGSPEAKRLEFIRREFLVPLEEAAGRWKESSDIGRELCRREASKAVNLLGSCPAAGFRVVAAEAQPLVPDGELKGMEVLRFGSKERTYIVRDLPKELKPSTRYRVSAFVKCREVSVFSGYDGGLNLEFTDGVTTARHPFPGGHHGVGYHGTMDWVACSFEFTTAATLGKDRHVAVRLANASGTAWFAGLRLEELR